MPKKKGIRSGWKPKTGHCPWSGKENEAKLPTVRQYLDSLPGRSRPTRPHRPNPRDASRAAAREASHA